MASGGKRNRTRLKRRDRKGRASRRRAEVAKDTRDPVPLDAWTLTVIATPPYVQGRNLALEGL